MLPALLPALALAAAARAATTTRVSKTVELRGAHQQMEGPEVSEDLVFSSAGWITAMSAHVVDARGPRSDGQDVHCHTVLSTQESEERIARFAGAGVRAEDTHLAFGDGIEDIRFPPGFGIRVASGTPYRVYSKLADANTTPPLQDLTDLAITVSGRGTRICHGSPEFLVPPGRHSVEKRFTMPYSARVHLITFHAHHYPAEVALEDAASGKPLFRAPVERDARGYGRPLPFYSSAQGLALEKGRAYVFRLVMDNPSREPTESMGIMRLYVHRAANAE